MLMLVLKNFFDYANVSPEKFFGLISPHPPPPVENIFKKKFYDFVKILGNVGQYMTPPPPPNVDGFVTSLAMGPIKRYASYRNKLQYLARVRVIL